MRRIIDRLVVRVLPALLTAAGVTALAAGLLTYTSLATGTEPTPAASPSAMPSAAPSLVPSADPSASVSASASASAPASPSGAPADRVATRIVIPALGIDLPIVEPAPNAYPLCNVAMYLPALGQPGQGRATYIYAHARTGMFLPLLTQSRIDGGSHLLGMLVQVYTSDDQLFLYEISKVLPHQLTLDAALNATTEQLWLQTSEGPKGTVPKLQILALPLSSGPADPAAAHPTPHPLVCG
jgi:hypothetical protein